MVSVHSDENDEGVREAPSPELQDRRELDPDSREWIDALASRGAQYEQACRRLHGDLLRIAFKELERRRGRHRLSGPELDDLAHQAAADALVAITRKTGQFRGESRFTTWAYKFVIFEVSTKIGRHFWSTGTHVRLDAEEWDRLPARLGVDPEEHLQANEMAAALRAGVDETLTAHQRRIFAALVLNGVPLDALVAELGTNRNAVYKTMFDARHKLRQYLQARGYLNEKAQGRS
jgi:RNA polymerase sigma-70 factor (ECF subfamily)